jgi:hypothetical protein
VAEKEYTRSEEDSYDPKVGGDWRPKFLPHSSTKRWRGRPPKDPLSYGEASVTSKGVPIEDEWRDFVPDRDRYTTEPYSSTRADLIYKEYYGKDTDRKLKEATEARFRQRPRYVPYTDKQKELYLKYQKANLIPEQRSETYSRGNLFKNILRDNKFRESSIIPRDATKAAKETLPVYRKLERGMNAGEYVPWDRAINLQSKIFSKEDDKQTLHHEVRHHMNLTGTDYSEKYIKPNLPKGGKLASGKYIHAFSTTNELTEAIADLKQQDYKATGIDMTKDRLNKLINSETLPAHFKGFRSNRFNAGNFINDLREWKKENPKKGKKLIDKIIRIQDQVVDVRKPNQSSKDVLKREILRQRYA